MDLETFFGFFTKYFVIAWILSALASGTILVLVVILLIKLIQHL